MRACALMILLIVVQAAFAIPAIALTEPHFLRDVSPPQHVVRMSVTGSAHSRPSARAVFYRDSWLRTEFENSGRKELHYKHQKSGTTASLKSNNLGQYQHLEVRRTTWYVRRRTNDSRRTGERQSVLGETCEVWIVPPSSIFSPSRESCITHDGIELAYKLFDGEGLLFEQAQAQNIERRPATDAEINLPADLFDLRTWGIDPDIQPAGKRPGDFELILKSSAGTYPNEMLEVRRHFPWTKTMRPGGVRFSTEFAHPAAVIGWGMGKTPMANFDSLTIRRNIPLYSPARLDRADTNTSVGEECTWFDMLPRHPHGAYLQCNTADGITLREIADLPNSALHYVLEPALFRRSAIAPSDVMPPKDILSFDYWQLPQ